MELYGIWMTESISCQPPVNCLGDLEMQVELSFSVLEGRPWEVWCQSSEPMSLNLHHPWSLPVCLCSAWPHWPPFSNVVFLKHVAQRLCHTYFFVSHCKFFNFVDNYINFDFKPFKLSIIFNISLAFLFAKEPQYENS